MAEVHCINTIDMQFFGGPICTVLSVPFTTCYELCRHIIPKNAVLINQLKFDCIDQTRNYLITRKSTSKYQSYNQVSERPNTYMRNVRHLKNMSIRNKYMAVRLGGLIAIISQTYQQINQITGRLTYQNNVAACAAFKSR